MVQSGAAWALLHRLSTDPALERAASVVCSGDDTALMEQSAALQRHTDAVVPTPFDLNDLAALLPRLIHHTARAHGRAACVCYAASPQSWACFVRLLLVQLAIH
jgi:hypothetical protein